MIKARIATAVVLLAACVGALLFLPNRLWAGLLLPVLLVAGREWSALSGLRGATGKAYVVLLLASATIVWLVLEASGMPRNQGKLPDQLLYGAGCAFWLVIAMPWLMGQWRVRSRAALAAAGWLVLVPSWIALARLQDHPERLLALLAIVWIADTAAYFSGRAWGRHKLAPAISPGKTWEGVAGAALAVAVYYLALSRALPEWGWWTGAGGILLFAGVAFMSVVGDLFESILKRQAGVKDSGALLPGHGGVLDRVDGMTAALPLAALLLPYAG